MLRKYIRLILFFSSYTPLFLIFGIQYPRSIAAYILLLLGVVSILILRQVLNLTRNLEPEPVYVTQVSYKDGEAMSYIVTYIIPFLGVNFTSMRNCISLIIMFLILAILYINSNLIYTNPLLNLCGYHIYELEVKNSVNLILISKRTQITINTSINAANIDGNIYLEVWPT